MRVPLSIHQGLCNGAGGEATETMETTETTESTGGVKGCLGQPGISVMTKD